MIMSPLTYLPLIPHTMMHLQWTQWKIHNTNYLMSFEKNGLTWSTTQMKLQERARRRRKRINLNILIHSLILWTLIMVLDLSLSISLKFTETLSLSLKNNELLYWYHRHRVCKIIGGGASSLGLPPHSITTPTRATSQSPTTPISGASGGGGSGS